jgi:hypothetical protein
VRLSALQDLKAIYRVTGTPENYLTALRSSTWGFKDDPKLRSQWKKLQPGDIIFFHASKSESKFLPGKDLKSCVVGFGVVGNHFFEGKEPLWIEEFEERRVIYPWRFHFSEIYLFADIPAFGDWESQNLSKAENTRALLKRMLSAGVPLNEMPQFPKMGSYSSIKDANTKSALLASTRGLYAYRTREEEEDALPSKHTEMREIARTEDALRNSTTLTEFDDIQARVIRADDGRRQIDVGKLREANRSHTEVLRQLLEIFRGRGYTCYQNNHIDLLAISGDRNRSVLVEAKSIENANFIPQARKGIVQLFEYNHFEVAEYKRNQGIQPATEHQLLALSRRPGSSEDSQAYLGFINSLNIRAAAVQDGAIQPLGDLTGAEELIG